MLSSRAWTVSRGWLGLVALLVILMGVPVSVTEEGEGEVTVVRPDDRRFGAEAHLLVLQLQRLPQCSISSGMKPGKTLPSSVCSLICTNSD